MKRILYYTIFSFVIITVLCRCYYDEVVVYQGLPQNVSLANDVQPIFDTNCNSSGCHDAEGSHAPSLTAENSYTSLTTGQYVNLLEPEKSVLYVELNNGMPPAGPLSTNDMKIILAWITEGAKDN